MPILFHAILGFILQVGVFVSAIVFLSGGKKLHVILIGAAGLVLVRFAYRRFVPAKCNAPGCGGSTFQKGSRPIYYKCSKCGHIHDTGIYEGLHSFYPEVKIGPFSRESTDNCSLREDKRPASKKFYKSRKKILRFRG